MILLLTTVEVFNSNNLFYTSLYVLPNLFSVARAPPPFFLILASLHFFDVLLNASFTESAVTH